MLTPRHTSQRNFCYNALAKATLDLHIMVEVKVNALPLTMEVDTEAVVLVMSIQQQDVLFPQAKLQPSKVVL